MLPERRPGAQEFLAGTPIDEDVADPRPKSKSPRKTRPVKRLGDFTILEEIGRGGMGVVFKARQESMGRLVALKVLQSMAGMDPAAVKRFHLEAEAAGKLSHPGIVPVFAVGQAGGIHYFAMELVEGPALSVLLDRLRGRLPERLIGSLAEETGIAGVYPRLKDPPGPPRTGERYARSCAAIIAEVAAALGAAHGRRVIHRDVKPSNILIHPTGRPVLVDFGLARAESSMGLTRSGDAMGTPSYMAPEQARGSRDLDSRVDVYGLGATLYELLTLQPPFDGQHPGEVMRRILDDDPEPVRKLNSRVPVDLETIVHTCLAKDPDDRYASVEALEMDLRAFLEDRPVAARPPSGKQRMVRFFQRQRRAAVAVVTTLMVAGVLAATMGVVSSWNARKEGLAVLERAREALMRGESLRANELYGRAQVLLGDEDAVQDARCEHFRAAFEALYPHRLAPLREAAAELDGRRRDRIVELLARVEGRGAIDVAGAPPDTTLEVRRLRDGGLDPEWRVVAPARPLPLGTYLVRIRRPGRPTVVMRAEVRRDEIASLRLPSIGVRDLPEDTALVVDSDGQACVAMDRHELTRGRYRKMLAEIPDPLLREELTPEGFDSAGPDHLPVTGLSHAQARAAAALSGGHLPSWDEYRMAATAGASGLRYPWGADLRPGVIAADPDTLSRPVPVDTYAAGGSPAGILHLLGNAAEFVARSGETPEVRLFGGHYQTPPGTLDLRDPASVLESVEGPTAPRVYAGMRLARFLARADEPKVERAVAKRRAEILGGGTAALVYDWTVGPDGSVRYELRMRGNHASAGARKALPLVTHGFAQAGSPMVADGHGRMLRVVRRQHVDLGGESSTIEVEFPEPVRKGQRYHLRLVADLLPTTGLRGVGDDYVLALPMKATGTFPTLHSVHLPPGCRVLRAEPRPTAAYAAGGVEHVVWEMPADRGGTRTLPALIRFRRDGALTDHWPSTTRAFGVARRLLRALSERDRDTLATLLDERFRMHPAGVGRELLLMPRGGGRVHEAFSDVRLRDVTAVGPVTTVDLTVTWRVTQNHREVAELQNWPLRLQLLRDGEDLRATSLAPAGRADNGVLEGGFYRHERLKVTIRPPKGVSLVRLQRHLAEMQVKLVRSDTHWVEVVGHYADPDENEAMAKVHLSSGAVLMDRGDLMGEGEDFLGPPGRQIRAEQSLRWVFHDAIGWSCERWTFVRKGLRWLLVKSVARGSTREEAEAEFVRSRAWFDRMSVYLEMH